MTNTTTAKNATANQTATTATTTTATTDKVTTEKGKQFVSLCYEIANGKTYGEYVVSYGGHSATIQARANGNFVLPVERLAIPFKRVDIDITDEVNLVNDTATAQTFTRKGEHMPRVYTARGYQTITDSSDIIANLEYIKQTVDRIDHGTATRQDCDTIIGLLANARSQLEKQSFFNLDTMTDEVLKLEMQIGVATQKGDTEKVENLTAEVKYLEMEIEKVANLYKVMGIYANKASNWKTKLENRESQTATTAFDGLLAIFGL